MKYLPTIKDDELLWVGVDLDKTLAEGIWPKEGIGKPIKGAREFLNKLVEKGFKITIFTSRPWSHHKCIEDWCSDNGMPVRRIICGKPLFRCTIDDRNIEFDGNFKKVLRKIK